MMTQRLWAAGLLVGFLGGVGCGRATPDLAEPLPVAAPSTAEAPPTVPPRILFLGDSLTAGYGLPREASYPEVIQRKLDAAGLAYQVVNAGVSGDTSAGGLERLTWSLEGDVRIVVVALGANDGLRGLPLTQLEANLRAIIERSQARGATVILAGLKAPPQAGPDYGARFEAVYDKLAKQYQLPFIPSLLEGVAGEEDLNQSDGIHPNEAGARVVADNVWKALEPVVRQAAASAKTRR